MEIKVRYFIFLTVFLGNIFNGNAQDFSTPPPEPMMVDESTLGPCGSGDGGGGPGIPPPVGRCLPIDDYIFPLFFSGIALGAFALFQLQKKTAN